MRTPRSRLAAAMAVVALAAAVAAPVVSAADTKDGRPRNSQPGEPTGGGKATYPKDRPEGTGEGGRRAAAAVDPADQVITDDLIVTGRECLGSTSCVNGESFGLEQLKLKAQNIRIAFDDTSGSGSGFPANDWELTANDSTSGGASRFSIADTTAGKVPFTVQAGAATDTLVVASNGNVGVGTRSPALDVHIESGNTPAMRFNQSGSGGFTPQTWDVGANEANFFVRDVTAGNKLPLRVRPGAPTSSIDVNGSGNVGLGTATPKAALHLSGTNPRVIRLERTGTTNPNAWDVGDPGNGSFVIDAVGVANVQVRVNSQGLFRVSPVAHPPTQSVGLGAMYNDTSGALCWNNGTTWLRVVGTGTCQ